MLFRSFVFSLKSGASLTEVIFRLKTNVGITATILPMSDQPVRTIIHSDKGVLAFQDYFVRRRCEPTLVDLSFVGAESATLSPEVRDALRRADLVVFCPSNPYVSIDPILSVPGLREMLGQIAAPKVAVSPIVGGLAIKGPAAKMMRELGEMSSPLTVVDHLGDVLDGFVMDHADAALADAVILPALVTGTVMTDLASKERLAQDVLAFAASLRHAALLAPAD